MDMPALYGRTVTTAHTALCAERGHATHTRDGVDTGTCPRCGEVTVEVVDVKAFDRLLQLELNLWARKTAVAMAPTQKERGLAAEYLQSDRDALYAALDALTPEQAKAFGKYRAEK